jgi:hypothetical protein
MQDTFVRLLGSVHREESPSGIGIARVAVDGFMPEVGSEVRFGFRPPVR